MAILAQFYYGETGFDSAYPPSDNQLLERLELLWETEDLGPALRPEVFRAAIAITAKGRGRDAVSPIDAAALQPENDVSTAATQARTRAGGRSATSAGAEHTDPGLIDGFDRDEILTREIFAAAPVLPDLQSIRSKTAIFWAGDEGVLVYRRQKGKRSIPTVDMEYVAHWPFLAHSIMRGASHANWFAGLLQFLDTYRHMMDFDPTLQTPVFPAHITCVIHSNLARCYTDDGD